eukprot:3611037-Alexandrium_andersonii.AAC.1
MRGHQLAARALPICTQWDTTIISKQLLHTRPTLLRPFAHPHASRNSTTIVRACVRARVLVLHCNPYILMPPSPTPDIREQLFVRHVDITTTGRGGSSRPVPTVRAQESPYR